VPPTDSDSLARRLEILRLPVVTLTRVRYPRARWSDTAGEWEPFPCATGVGPGRELLHLFRGRAGSSGSALVTRSTEGGADFAVSTVLHDVPDGVGHPQPMPGDAVLLTYSSDGTANAGVWDREGRQVAAGDLGTARHTILTTPTGRVWVAYFDEAISGPGPCVLARFGPDLVEEWRYDLYSMPEAIDCYALNVDGETATALDDHRGLTQVADDGWRRLGEVPVNGGGNLILDGDRVVVVGGYGPEYDLLTPLRIDGDGVHRAGPPQRLVFPDGMEFTPNPRTSRGRSLTVVRHKQSPYRLDLADVAFD